MIARPDGVCRSCGNGFGVVGFVWEDDMWRGIVGIVAVFSELEK